MGLAGLLKAGGTAIAVCRAERAGPRLNPFFLAFRARRSTSVPEEWIELSTRLPAPR
jgi:hypothetical protein